MSLVFEEIADLDKFYEMEDSEAGQVRMSLTICDLVRKALKAHESLEEGEPALLLEIRGRHLNILQRLVGIKDEFEAQTLLMQYGSTSFKKVLTVNKESRAIDQGKGMGGQKTKMLAELAARPYLVEYSGGCFARRSRSGAYRVFSTMGMESHGKANFGGYVLDLRGQLYVFNHLDKSDRVAHSSFVRGAPVLAAGELRILDGCLMAITSHSGHYRPDAKTVFDTLSHFKKKGLSLRRAVVFFVIDPEIPLEPLSGDDAPWVFMSSTAMHNIISEGIGDDTEKMKDDEVRQQTRVAMRKYRNLMQVELNKYIYRAGDFMKAMQEKARKEQEALDKFLES